MKEKINTLKTKKNEMSQIEFEEKLKTIIKSFNTRNYASAIKNACEFEYYWNSIEDIADSASLNIPIDCNDLQEQLNIIEASIDGILNDYI